MSFRTRLITFFLLIVTVPMIAVGILILRLIDDSLAGKSQARASGLASAAASVYLQSSRSASYDARTVAKLLEPVEPARCLPVRSRSVARSGSSGYSWLRAAAFSPTSATEPQSPLGWR